MFLVASLWGVPPFEKTFICNVSQAGFIQLQALDHHVAVLVGGFSVDRFSMHNDLQGQINLTRRHLAILPELGRQWSPVIEQQIQDHAGGNRGQKIVVAIVANPVVTAWGPSEVALLPVIDDILLITPILIGHPVAPRKSR